jgi:hypothetical protein
MKSRGASLLELLLALAVMMSMLPFIYRFALDQREKMENAAVAHKVKIVSDALEQYVFENRQALLAPLTKNVTRVKIGDLPNLPLDELKDAKIQLRVVKSKDSAGRSFVQGMVIFDSGNLTPLRTRQIASAGGALSGFAEGKMLYGSFGTWRAPLSELRASAGPHSILAETKPFRSGGDYLRRLPGGQASDATMQSDLDLGGHDVLDAKDVSASRARFLDILDAGSIEANRMTVANRLDWSAPIEVFGDALVSGAISSDGRSVDAAKIVVFGASQFRSVEANSLSADNLYLSGFSVAGDGAPPVLKISGALDMAQGHVKAMETTVGFSGSVAPKLVAGNRLEDAANPDFYWDFAGEARLGDMQLTNLPPMIRAAWAAERTGGTETERIMGPVIQNSNATVSDYIRALEQTKKAVAAKYGEIGN